MKNYICLDKIISRNISVYGRVQSVGFRPFVYRLAKKYELAGYVKNITSGVEIKVQGEKEKVENFISELRISPPEKAIINKIVIEEKELDLELSQFQILESKIDEVKNITVAPEIKICSDCLNELFNPCDRRYLYPFINCTNCGPRFTIITSVPYDRENTTMAKFKMCEKCYEEYNDITNRRFHAQPNACYSCGPGIEVKKVVDGKLKTLFPLTKSFSDVEKVLEFITNELLNNKIFAIKSYGGYHIMCNATNDEVVLRLRKAKYREYKPFALMAKNLQVIEKFCIVSNEEKNFLSSSEAPIVILRKKQLGEKVSSYVAPNNSYLGFMLPYTPLQYLIFFWLEKKGFGTLPLVMTSGNISDEPIAFKDEDCYNRLRYIVDYFITYNREINIRCDDSVVRVIFNFNKGATYFIRRSRGYVPEPILVDEKFKHKILGVGGELKNTFCLATENRLILSHHIGDLDNMEVFISFKDSIEYYKKFFCFTPEVIVHDLHPEYLSTKYAEEIKNENYNIFLTSVQHHFAHFVSCIVDNEINDECIGIIFDGTGYGLDKTIWGSEFFVGNRKTFSRRGHFGYIDLISGNLGIKEPYRTAIGYLLKNFPEILSELSKNRSFSIPFFEKFYSEFKDYELRIKGIEYLLNNKINIIKTCGMGRIFDLVSVLCGTGLINYYEGQLPAEIEYIAEEKIDEVVEKNEKYRFEIFSEDGKYIVDTKLIVSQILEDLINKISINKISAKFHYTISCASVDLVLNLRKETGINNVILSGGVFQNMILLKLTTKMLKDYSFNVYFHKKFPCNDGGISVGQVVAANHIILSTDKTLIRELK